MVIMLFKMHGSIVGKIAVCVQVLVKGVSSLVVTVDDPTDLSTIDRIKTVSDARRQIFRFAFYFNYIFFAGSVIIQAFFVLFFRECAKNGLASFFKQNGITCIAGYRL